MPEITASNILAGVTEGETLVVNIQHGLLADDADAGGFALTVTAVSAGSAAADVEGGAATIDGSYGTLVINGDGSFSYAATGNLSLPADGVQDVFAVTISDGDGNTAQATLTVAVLPPGQSNAPYVITYNADSSVHDVFYAGETGEPDTAFDVLYGTNGKPATVTYGNGETAIYTYDSDGSLHDIAVTGVTGEAFTSYDITYNADGSIHDIDYAGVSGQPYVSVDVIYGTNGQPSTATYSNGMTATWTYNADNSLHDISYTNVTGEPYTAFDVLYGANGKPATVTYGNGETAIYTYDSDGSLHDVAVTGVTGEAFTSYDITYNADGSIHDIDYAGVSGQPYVSVDVIYGTNGQPSTATYSNGMTATWTYNADNSLHDISYTNVTGEPYTAFDVLYGANGKPATVTYGNGETAIYTYDSDGSLHDIAVTGVTGEAFTSYDITYNADGSIHDIDYVGVSGQPYVSVDVIYGVNGQPSTATYSNGMTETWTYNSDGSVTVTFAVPPTLTIANHSLAIGEDGTVALGIAETPFNAGDTILITVAGVPADAMLSAGINNGNGTWTLTPDQLVGLTLKAGEVATATLTVTATDTAGLPASAPPQTIMLTVEPAAPALAIANHSLSVKEDGTVGLGVSETPFDPRDEVLVTITGVPSDAMLSAGTNNGGGNWSLTPAQLSGLMLTAGTTSATLDVLATNTEGTTASAPMQSIALTVVAPPAAPVFDLSKADQSGAPGSHQTQSQIVTLVGQTGAGDTVTLESTGQSTIANTTGGFQFDSVSLALGNNALTVRASDSFGQSTTYSLTVQREAAVGGTDPVLQWNQTTLAAIAADADAPTVASRALAMESIAVYDVISAIDGTPGYLVNASAASDASAAAAVAEAADTVLDYLYPAQAATFDAQLQAALVAITDGQGKTDGTALGQQVAQDIIALRANDGSSDSVIDNGSTAVGQWQPTAPGYGNAVTPQWANVTPFALESSDQFLPPPPPALDSAAYAAAVNETESLGAGDSTTRTAAETQSALFWNDQTGTYTPPGEWNAIADQIAQTQGNSMAQDAQLLAELNAAEADSAIAAWNTKYTYNAWRPITAIQNANEIGNSGITQDSTWTPLITTPAFPEYVAGHAVFSEAAAQVLDSFFGSNYAFTAASPSLAGVTLSFASFDAAAQNAGDSRIWGGIHFSFSVDAGFTVGQEVGDWTLNVFNQSQDTVPPKILMNQTTGLVTNTDPTITGDVTDNLSGVASLAVSLDGGTATNVSFDANGNFSVPVSLPTDGTADGQHTLTFTAVDAAGNVTNPLTFDFILDTQAPQIALASNSVQDGGTLAAGAELAGTVTTETGVTLTALSYAFDGGTAMPMRFDPTTSSFDQSLDLSQLGAGSHTLTLTATDAAGNTTTDRLNLSLPALPLLTITSLMPMMGASDVGVTYRPEVTFSRAINPATLTSSSFYATDSSGDPMPATIVPTTDSFGNVDGAWLLFANQLPGASTITLHVQGDQIKGADGTLLDAAGTGTPGTDLTETFTTVSTAPVPNTTITGIVVDPGPDDTPMTTDDFKAAPDGSLDFANDTWKLPIAGVKVYVLGDEQDAVYTNAQGQFTLTNVPVGDVKVVFDGTTATSPPAGFYFPTMTMDLANVQPGVVNTVMGSMGTTQEQQADAGDPAVYLPRLAQNILTPVSTTTPTTVTAPANTDFGSGQTALTAQQLSELSLTVQPGSIVDANGNPVQNPEVGISPVPPAIVQDMLPPGLLQHTFDITIQAPGGAVFTQPATLTMPNTLGLAPGTKTYILSFDHTTGMLVIDGTATVSADGLTVVSDPGSGVTAPGWHGFTPPGSPFGGGGGGGGGGPQGQKPGCNGGSNFQKGSEAAIDTLQQSEGLAADFVDLAGDLGHTGKLAGGLLNGFAIAGDIGSLIADYNNSQGGLPLAADIAALTLDLAGLIPGPIGLVANLASVALELTTIAYDVNSMRNAALAQQQAWQSCNGGGGGQSAPMPDASAVLTLAAGSAAAVFPTTLEQNFDAAAQVVQDEANSWTRLINEASSIMPLAAAFDPQNPQYGGLSQQNYLSLTSNLAGFAADAKSLAASPSLVDAVTMMGAAYADYANAMAAGMFSGSGTAAEGSGGDAAAATPSAPMAASSTTMMGDSSPALGNHLYAALQSPDGNVQRFQFDLTAGISYFLEPDTLYSLTVFDPSSLLVGSAVFMSASSGSTTPVPLVGMAADSGTPGADGLTPTAAFVIGVNNGIADNLVPGVTDLAALQEGLASAPSLVTTTGVVASLPLQGEAQAIVLAGSPTNAAALTAYIATGTYGLAIVDVSSFQSPSVLSQLQLSSGTATGVAVDTAIDLAAVADGTSGLKIINVADPTNPELVQTVAIDATTVQVVQGIAYANDGNNLDAVDLATGEILQTLKLGGTQLSDIASDGSMLYVMDTNDTLSTIDISSGAMVKDGSITVYPGGGKIFEANGVVYVPTNDVYSGGYSTVDVSNPSAPTLLQGPDNAAIESGAIALNGSGLGVVVGKDGGGSGGVVALDVVDTSNPDQTGQFVTRYALPAQPQDLTTEPFGVAIADGIAFVAAGTSGLQVVNYESFDTTGIPPTVQVTPPASVDNGPGLDLYQGENVTLGVTVTSNVQVRNVELLVNGQVVTNEVSYPWQISTMLPTIAANGSNQVTLQVEAFDTGGDSTLSTPIDVTLVPDTTPPQLAKENISQGEDIYPTSRAFIFDFSEPLDEATVTSTTFALIGPGGQALTPQTIQFGDNNQEVEFDYATLAGGNYQFDIAAPNVTNASGIALGSTDLTTGFTVLPFTAVWNNPAGGSWTVGSNWLSGQVPGATDTVLVGLPPGETVTFGSGTATIASLTVAEGGTLAISAGDLTVTGLLDVTSGILQLNDFGTIQQATIINSSGTIVYAGGTLDGVTYQGTLDLSAASSLVLVKDGIALAGSGGSGDGTIDLTGSGSALYVLDSETLDNVTLNIGSSAGSTLDNYASSGTGVLTLGSHLTINQTGSFADLTNYSSNGIVNDGTINADFKGGDLTISGFAIGVVSFINQGTINVSNGDTVTINANSWSNSGSIGVSGGTLNLGGNFTLAQLGTLTRAGGTVNVTGTLDDTGATLNVGTGTALGTVTLASGGTIKNGTIADAGSGLALSGGTLDGVTYQGTLDLSTAFSYYYVKDGLTMTGAGGSGNGTINLTGSDDTLYAVGTETLDNATLNIGNSSGDDVDSDDVSGPAVLTLGSHLTVNQTGGNADFSGSGIVNAGTINAGFNGGNLTIGDVSFTNQGTIDVSNGDTVNINATSWSNSGSISVSGGTLNLRGSLTLAQLGTLTHAGGTVNVTGTLDDTGATLNVGTGTALGTVTLASGGTIKNGTIADAGSGLALSGGTLDGVTYEGTLDVSVVYVKDGITLTGVGGSGNGTVNLTGSFGSFYAVGTETLDNATLNVGSGYVYNDDVNGPAVLTLGSHLTVNQTGGNADFFGYNDFSGSGIVNDGAINAGFNGGTFTIGDVSFTNQGTINVSNGDTVIINATSWSNTGSISLSGGTLNLGGSFTLAQLGTLARTGGTVDVTGTLDDTGVTLNVGTGATLGALTLASNGTIKNGTIAVAGSGLALAGGTLDGVTYQGTLDLSAVSSGVLLASSSVYVKDGITLTGVGGSGNGTINLTGTLGYLYAVGTETLDNATLNIGNNSYADYVYNDDDSAPAVLTLGSHLTVNQTGGLADFSGIADRSGSGIVNDGTIDAGFNGGNLTIADVSFTNQGTINVANGDKLVITAPLNGNGTISIASQGSVEITGAVAAPQTMAFSDGNADVLRLDNSVQFAGTITGFAGTNQIDLSDITAGAKATIGYSENSGNNGGKLTVSDGTHTANIALLGQYVAANFAAASDGHGGTLITDPAVNPLSQVQLTQPHA
jgi:hypothetical protein